MTNQREWPGGYWKSTSDFSVHVIIEGPPAVLKNRQQIVKRGKRSIVIPSKSAKDWTDSAVKQASFQWPFNEPIPIDIPLAVRIITYAPTRHLRDLDNSLSGPLDMLQPAKRGPLGKVKKPGAGIISNDSQVKSLDGSRLRYDKERPRVEITIEPFQETTG